MGVKHEIINQEEKIPKYKKYADFMYKLHKSLEEFISKHYKINRKTSRFSVF